jgi:ATP synthase protein I
MKIVWRMLAVEFLSVAALIFFVWVIRPEVLVSVVWAGAVFLFPNAYFAFYAFRYSGAGRETSVLLSFFRGQTGKTLLTAAGFALAFSFAKPLNVGFLMGAYILLLFLHVLIAAKVSGRFGQSNQSHPN